MPETTGNVIDLSVKLREKWVNGALGGIKGHYEKAGEIAEEYYQLSVKDPLSAVDRLGEFIGRARKIDDCPEGLKGGPNQDCIVPMMNILGIMYPFLERDVREKGLTSSLRFLNGLRYDYSQNHVELINEPWLAADIVINEGLYWCGYKTQTDILEKSKTWPEFFENMKSSRSDFWLAIAVTRPKYSSLEVRTKFYQNFPELIDRTKDAIAAISFEHAVNANKRDGTKIEDYIANSLSKYDPLLHEDIRKKMEEKKWIRLEDRIF